MTPEREQLTGERYFRVVGDHGWAIVLAGSREASREYVRRRCPWIDGSVVVWEIDTPTLDPPHLVYSDLGQ